MGLVFMCRVALDKIGLKRYCCRRMMLTHVDLITKLLNYNSEFASCSAITLFFALPALSIYNTCVYVMRSLGQVRVLDTGQRRMSLLKALQPR